VAEVLDVENSDKNDDSDKNDESDEE